MILVYHNLQVMESLAEECRTIHFLHWCLMEARQTHMIVEGPSIDLKSTTHIRLVWPARTLLTDTEGMSHFDITFMYCAPKMLDMDAGTSYWWSNSQRFLFDCISYVYVCLSTILYIKLYTQWCSQVFLRQERVIKMTAPNRNYEIMINHNYAFIWLKNQCFHLKY